MARGHSCLGLCLVAACACGRTNVRPGLDAAVEPTLTVKPEHIVFPPTTIGMTSTVPLELGNFGATDENVALVAFPPFRLSPSVTVPAGGIAIAGVEFVPTEVGRATGTLTLSSRWNEELVVTLEGEGMSRCGAGCNDGDACTVDLCDEQRGCFHEAVICPPARSVCEIAECHPALGCQVRTTADGIPCDTSSCGGTIFCRAGQCAEGGPVRLVGHWTFDEPEGTTILDASGLGHHGELVAGTRVPSRRARGVTHTDGALLVDVPDDPVFAFSSSFTVQAWIETPDALPMDQQVLVFRGDVREALDPLVLSLQPHGARFLVEGPLDGMVVDPSAPVPFLSAVQLTGVFDAEAREARLYVDCMLAATKCSVFTTPIRELNASSEPGVGLGGHARRGGSLYPFRGVLDEVRLYEGAMTQADVASSCAQ